jgi:hypothetical protein
MSAPAMAMAQGARAAVSRVGIPASLFRALPGPSARPVLCRSRSSVTTAAVSALNLARGGRGRLGVVFCAPSSSASASVSVEAPAAADVKDVAADLDLLDIRVGKVLKAWKHPEADSLFVEVGVRVDDAGWCEGVAELPFADGEDGF